MAQELVYIVTAGSHDDYHIEQVFADFRAAQQYCALKGDQDFRGIEAWNLVAAGTDIHTVRILRYWWRHRDRGEAVENFQWQTAVNVDQGWHDPLVRIWRGKTIFLECIASDDRSESWWITHAREEAQELFALARQEAARGLDEAAVNQILRQHVQQSLHQ